MRWQVIFALNRVERFVTQEVDYQAGIGGDEGPQGQQLHQPARHQHGEARREGQHDHKTLHIPRISYVPEF